MWRCGLPILEFLKSWSEAYSQRRTPKGRLDGVIQSGMAMLLWTKVLVAFSECIWMKPLWENGDFMLRCGILGDSSGVRKAGSQYPVLAPVTRNIKGTRIA